MDGLIPPPEILKLAGHPIRWSVLTRLARSDYRVQELVAFLQLPQNLVSYHLRQLRAGDLVTERKSSADERSVYYSLDLEQFRVLYVQAGSQLHPALTNGLIDPGVEDQHGKAPHTPLRVLFLCTHNSSRSQMAEGLLRARGGAAYEVFSAGTEPRVVHPLAIKVMQELGIDVSSHRAKSLEEFREQSPMDLVVTVCDEAAEACPYFPNARRQVHWGFSDPSRVEGSEEERLAAFRHIRDLIAAKIQQFLGLQPATSLEKLYAAAKAQENPS